MSLNFTAQCHGVLSYAINATTSHLTYIAPRDTKSTNLTTPISLNYMRYLTTDIDPDGVYTFHARDDPSPDPKGLIQPLPADKTWSFVLKGRLVHQVMQRLADKPQVCYNYTLYYSSPVSIVFPIFPLISTPLNHFFFILTPSRFLPISSLLSPFDYTYLGTL